MIGNLSYYVHDVPGRLRVKIPTIKGNSHKSHEVRKLFNNLKGIKSISLNTSTGSVVIHYDSNSLKNEEILNVLTENNLFDESKAITNDHYIQNMVTKGGGAIGRMFFGWIVEKALEEYGLSFLAVLI